MADATAAVNSWRGTGTPGSKGIPSPVKALETIEEGTLTIITAGYVLDGTNAAASVFGGVAAEDVTGGATDGAEMVRLIKRGLFAFAAAASAATDLGKEVYLADNQTYVVAAPGTGDIKIGRVVGWDTDNGLWIAGAKAIIKIDAYC